MVCVSDHVLVSEWLDGIPLARIIAGGTAAQRDRAGIMIIRFLFSGPARVGLLHADPHPGNFRLLADGRLGVLDFGAVARLPGGFPPIFGRVLRLMHDGGDLAKLEEAFRSHGYLRDGVSVDLTALRAFLAPLAEPSRAESFRFSREWLRTETTQASALRSSSVLRRLNLPPSYVLIHRVLASGLGVLCQLECEAPFRAEVLRWLPGYADTAAPAPRPQPACARSASPAGSAPAATANGHAGSAPAATANGHAGSAPAATANGHAGSAPAATANGHAGSAPASYRQRARRVRAGSYRQRARRVRACSYRQRARRVRAASQAAGAGRVHAAGQSGAAGKDGAAGSACLASWARTDNMVVRAVEGHHG